MSADDEPRPDRQVLKLELDKAGFAEPDIERALEWLDGLSGEQLGKVAEATARAVRIFSGQELLRLDTDVRGYLMYLENVRILSGTQRELVIDRLMALEADEIDIEQVKWVVLMVLFSQTGTRIRLRADGRPGLRRALRRFALDAFEQQSRYRGIACQGEDHQEVPRQRLRSACLVRPRPRSRAQGRRRRSRTPLRDEVPDRRTQPKAHRCHFARAQEGQGAVPGDRPPTARARPSRGTCTSCSRPRAN